MPFYEDFTDFKNGQRNGWENGPHLPYGEIRLENGSYFWSGDLKVPSKPSIPIQPSLIKTFPLSEEEQLDRYIISFFYRVHRLQAGEATELPVAVCTDGYEHLGVLAWLTEKTPIDQWIPVKDKSSWFRSSTVLYIGTGRGLVNNLHRKIDITNILVTRITPALEIARR
ncbi:hypothetical protein [Pseudomonas sp. R1-7]|uniref:hypothetical protein n=1 Tax=Pseudomonas sp. R1-7 TaxID=2817398 RepID=UPI003DA843FA